MNMKNYLLTLYLYLFNYRIEIVRFKVWHIPVYCYFWVLRYCDVNIHSSISQTVDYTLKYGVCLRRQIKYNAMFIMSFSVYNFIFYLLRVLSSKR